jgi:hypothetical protein
MPQTRTTPWSSEITASISRDCSSVSSPGSPRHLVERQLGEDGDPVPALLAVRLDVVAERLDLHPGKALIDRLDLLQHDDIGLLLLQPFGQRVHPRLDPVDVPGGDPHQAFP